MNVDGPDSAAGARRPRAGAFASKYLSAAHIAELRRATLRAVSALWALSATLEGIWEAFRESTAADVQEILETPLGRVNEPACALVGELEYLAEFLDPGGVSGDAEADADD